MGEFRITGPGKYRQTNGKVAVITRNDGSDTYPWEGLDDNGCKHFWNEDGTWRDRPDKRDLVARIDEPQTEMAGLSGFDLYDDQGHYRRHYKSLAEAIEDNAEKWRIFDRSLIPASAIVKPEPKRETRKVWIVHDCYGVTTVLGEKPSASVGDRLTPNDALISHIREQDVSFPLVAGDAS